MKHDVPSRRIQLHFLEKVVFQDLDINLPPISDDWREIHVPSAIFGGLIVFLVFCLYFLLMFAGKIADRPVIPASVGTAYPLTVVPIEATQTSGGETESTIQPEPIADSDPDPEILHVTCYGPPAFTLNDGVAHSPWSIADGMVAAESIGADGICAVARDTDYWDDIKTDRLPVLFVEGHGTFIGCDRIGRGSDIDIWVPYRPGTDGPQWSHDCAVSMIGYFSIQEEIYVSIY